MQTRERGRERNLPMSISNLVSQPSWGHNRARSRGGTTSGLQPLCHDIPCHTWVGTGGATSVLGSHFHTEMTSNYQTVHRSDCKPHDHKPKLSGSWFTFYPYHQCLWSCHFRTRKSGAGWRGGVKDTGKGKRVASPCARQCFRTCDDSRLTYQTLHNEAAWRKRCRGTLRTYLGPEDEALALSFQKEVSYDSQPSLLQTGLCCSVVGA